MHEKLKRHADSGSPPPSPAPNHDDGIGKGTLTERLAAGKNGKGLPWNLRTLFEQSLGRDLGGVRVHDDAEAAELADAVNARAFASGNDIAFAHGEYAPDTSEGRRLLAHEVAHTVQQSGAARTGAAGTTTPGDAAEANANAAADAMLAGKATTIEAQPHSVARKTKDEKDDKKPLPSNPKDLVSVTEGKLAKSGSLATKVKKDEVAIDGPEIKMAGSASLTPAALQADEDVGTVEVGPIQNVTSRRIGVYRKPGVAEPVARYNSAVHGLLDQRPDGNDAKKAWAKQPWYQPPATLNKDTPVNTVAFRDQPGFDLPIKNGGGVLSEIQGADEFVTSVAVRRNGGAVVHISSQQWSIPWDMKIDPSTHLGDIGAKNETTFRNDNKIVPTVLDGPIATNAVDYYSFPSVEAARAAGVDALLGPRGLAAARGRDKDSYMNMWHAIRGLNPAWSISVKCIEHTEIWSDPVTVTMRGNSGSKADGFKMSKGDLKYTYVRFLELFDPDKWTAGDALRFTIQASKHTFKEISMLRPDSDAFQQVTFSDGSKNARYEYAVTRTDNGG